MNRTTLKLCGLLIWSQLLLVTNFPKTAMCQHWDFIIEGAAYRTDTTNGRTYAHAIQSDSHYEYGLIWSDAPGYPQFLAYENKPRVSMSLRLNSDGHATSARTAFHSAPAGSSCPWPSAPGAKWMPLNVASGIMWDQGVSPNIYANFPDTTGTEAASGSIDTGITVRLSVCVDDLFVWWANGGADGTTFAYAMQIPPTQTAYLTVGVPYECEPFLFGFGSAWVLHQRVDFRIRVFDAEPPATDADFDGDSDVDDLFAFLAAWFATKPTADWDGDAAISVPDIFAFLSEWMTPR